MFYYVFNDMGVKYLDDVYMVVEIFLKLGDMVFWNYRVKFLIMFIVMMCSDENFIIWVL